MSSTTSKSLSKNLNNGKSLRDKRAALAEKAKNSQKSSKSHSSYKGKGKKKESSTKRRCGLDTEYDTDPATGEPIPVTTQIAIPCEELPDNLFELEARITKKDIYGLKILKYGFEDVKGIGKFLWIVVDSRDIEPGLPYATHLGTIFNWYAQHLCKWDVEREHECYVLAHYLNAEWSLIAPYKADLKKLKQAQGDDCKDSDKDLQLIPIQKTAHIKNFRLEQQPNVKFHFADTMHLFGKGGVEDVGASIGLPKLWHPDFNTKPFSEWLEEDPEAAIAYAARDAVITCAAHAGLHNNRDSIAMSLCNSNLIDRQNKIITKMLDERCYSLTAASITDRFYRAHIESKGYSKQYDDVKALHYSSILPPQFQITKGGLNKKFDSDRPSLIRNCFRADVVAQYPTAKTMLKLPLVLPVETWLSGMNEWKSFKYVAKQLRKLGEDKDKFNLIVDWELPKNCPEKYRLLVAKDPNTGDGCTVLKAEYQIVKHWELFAQAHFTPDAKIRVRRCIQYSCRVEGKDYFTLKPVVEFFMSERAKYKAVVKRLSKLKSERELLGSSLTEDEELALVGAELNSNAVKLIMNGGAGKLAQCKQGYDPSSLNQTIMNDGEVSSIANGKMNASLMYDPDAFNDVTAMSRTFTGVAAAINDTIMAVTDSVVAHGKFNDPSQLITEYPQLNELLTTFKFDMEALGVDEVVFKEREHMSFDWNRGKFPSVEIMRKSDKLAYFILADWFIPEYNSLRLQTTLESGEDYLPEKCNIEKFASRGVRRIQGVSEQESRLILFKQMLPRFQGKAIKLEQTRLTGFKEYLKGSLLNRRETTEKVIRAHNPRYNCESLDVLDLRKQVDYKCRKKGYEDILDYETHDPRGAAKLKAETVHKPRVSRNYPLQLKQMLAILNRECGISYSPRFIEKLFDSYGLKVSDTTISRWFKAVEQGKAYDALKRDYGWSEANFFKKSAWTEKLKTDVEAILELLGGAS